jgi:hypothetical protein
MKITETLKNEYDNMYSKFVQGDITEQVWKDYVDVIFDLILEENKEVLVRLKHT